MTSPRRRPASPRGAGARSAPARAAVLTVGPPGDRHHFALHGRYFWVDAPTGAVHELSAIAWALLTTATEMAGPPNWSVPVAAVLARLQGRHPRADLTRAAAELLDLAAAGLLFTRPATPTTPPAQAAAAATPPTVAPPAAAATAAAGVIPARPGVADPPLRLRGLSLHVAHACNLRCRYCFAGDGTYHRPAELMSPATARAAVDFLFAWRDPTGPLVLEFFGGEPLLNLAAVKAAASHARRRAQEVGQPLHLTVSTNGTHLEPEVVALLTRHQIEVVVSLDGRPSVHDAMRPGPGGAASYETVRAGLKRLLAQPERPPCYVRAVFTRHNTDFAADAEHLLRLPVDGVAMEPAVGGGQDWSLHGDALAAAERAYEELALDLARRGASGRPDRFLPFAVPDAAPAPHGCGRGCGAGVFELAVAPDGGLYPCHRFVGYPEFQMGTLQTGLERREIGRAFAAATAATKAKCQTCWARSWCGGGCQANGYEANGSILEPDDAECRLRRKRLECAFWLRAAGGDD